MGYLKEEQEYQKKLMELGQVVAKIHNTPKKSWDEGAHMMALWATQIDLKICDLFSQSKDGKKLTYLDQRGLTLFLAMIVSSYIYQSKKILEKQGKNLPANTPENVGRFFTAAIMKQMEGQEHFEKLQKIKT